MYILHLFLIAANVLFFAETTHLQAKDDATTILCYGNSITAGYGLNQDEAFPAILETILQNKGISCKVINAGLSGETSAGGLSRINWIIKQPIDIFILELGGNDGLRGLPLEQTEKNLQEIINKVIGKYPEVKIVIAGMMVPPNMGEDYGNTFVQMFPKLAKSNNAILIPFLLENVGGNPELNLPDGIHPTAEGHKIVANTVYSAIESLIK